MWIKLDNDLFETNECISELRYLLGILSYKSRYNFFIDIENIENQDIFSNFYPETNDVIYQNYDTFINNCPTLSYIVSLDANHLSLIEAIQLLENKFYLILENSTYDGYFFNALMREFKNKSKKIKQFKENNWFDYEMGGGADNIKTLLQGKNLKLYKCFVLIDSDKDFKDQKGKKDDFEKFLKDNNISYHILEKREIENYLPLNIIGGINQTNLAIKAYLNLNDSQKDYFDLQYGLKMSRENLLVVKPEVYDLYSSVSDANYNLLRNGIENEFENFKRDFSRLFDLATQEGLIERTSKQENPDELKDILKKITELL